MLSKVISMSTSDIMAQIASAEQESLNYALEVVPGNYGEITPVRIWLTDKYSITGLRSAQQHALKEDRRFFPSIMYAGTRHDLIGVESRPLKKLLDLIDSFPTRRSVAIRMPV